MSELISKLKTAVSILQDSDKELDSIDQDISTKKYELIALPHAGRIELKDIAKNDSIRAEIRKLENKKDILTASIEENRQIVYDILLPFKGREVIFDFLITNDYTDSIMLEVSPVVSQSVGNGFIRSAPRKPQFNIYLNKNKIA